MKAARSFIIALLFGVAACARAASPHHAVASPVHGTPCDGFVHVQKTELIVCGRPIFVKGVNYIGGRYITDFIKDSANVEHENNWETWHQFDAAKIDAELHFLATSLNLNAVRILTPARSAWEPFIYWHHWEPWFLDDGAINPLYLAELKTVVALAKKNGLRVQLQLFLGVQQETIGKSFIPPGGSEEAFYLTYLRSLIPAFASEPAILSYEVGNEMLVNWQINYWMTSWWEERMLSFLRRMDAEIRRLDAKHLLTSGEVIAPPVDTAQGAYTTTWFWPSPEFGLVSDVDGLNNYDAYCLYDLVDYISPHLYTKTEWIGESVRLLKNRSAKPVVLGEFGYIAPDPLVMDKAALAPFQLAQYKRLAAAIAAYHLNGVQPWAVLPLINFSPADATATTWAYGIWLTVLGPPKRVIQGYGWFSFELFTDDTLAPLPAASIFKGMGGRR